MTIPKKEQMDASNRIAIKNNIEIKNNNAYVFVMGIFLIIMGLFYWDKSKNLIAIFFTFFLAIFMFLSWEKTQITISKVDGAISYKKRTLFSKTEEKRSLREVSSIQFYEEEPNLKMAFRNTSKYFRGERKSNFGGRIQGTKIYAIFRDGSMLPLRKMALKYSIEYVDFGREVAKFIGVPFSQGKENKLK
jgi:hypothetical protein